MGERIDTVVVGGGQAGLSVSYYLTQHNREHVVLEQGRLGETWRTQRWDSFRLNTPNSFLQLPGHAYAGGDPEGFLSRDETIAYLEGYADRFRPPLRTGVQVSALRPRDGGGYMLDTSSGTLEADNAVVATGSFSRPTPPQLAGEPAPGLLHLHASEYRRPEQLPAGAVLVIGSGQSGCQIAADLVGAGRRVYLSVGHCPSLPLYYRGRQTPQWLIDIGMMDDTVDTLPSPAARLACNPTIASARSDYHRDPRLLVREGVGLLGRVEAVDGWRAHVQPDLAARLAESDEFAARFKTRIDEFVRTAGLELPEEPADGNGLVVPDEVNELDLRRAGVNAVVWANGYRPDFGWVQLPLFDTHGWPRQARGVSEAPGLYFAGLHWLHKRKSALLLGVGEDAAHVAGHIAPD